MCEFNGTYTGSHTVGRLNSLPKSNDTIKSKQYFTIYLF